jgi:hypothetical protein
MDISTNEVTNNKYDNKKDLTFREIAPRWFERLNKLRLMQGSSQEKESIYSDINDYKMCIVGEAYRFNPSYVVYGSSDNCKQCIAFSRNFVYYVKESNFQKFKDIEQEFTKHWNNAHTSIILTTK